MGLFDRFKKNKPNETDRLMSFYSQMRNEDIMENSGKENLDAFEVAFGKTPDMPFFLAVPPGHVLKYLTSEFMSDDGQKLSFRRDGSYDSDVYAGSSDQYTAFTPDGRYYTFIYVNDYCRETSIKTPLGFKTKYGRVTAPINNLNLNPKTGYVTDTIPDKFLIAWYSGDKNGAIQFLMKSIIEMEQSIQIDIETMSARTEFDWLAYETTELRVAYHLLQYFGEKNNNSDISNSVVDPLRRMIVFGRLQSVYVPLLANETLEDYPPCYNARNPDPVLNSILGQKNLTTWNDVLAAELKIYGFDAMRQNWRDIVYSDTDVFDLDISRAEYLLFQLMKQHSCDKAVITDALMLICEIAAVDITGTSEGATCMIEVMKMAHDPLIRLGFYMTCCYRLNCKLEKCNIKLEIDPEIERSLRDSGSNFTKTRNASQALVSDLISQLDRIKSHSFKNLPAIKDAYRILGELSKI